MKRIGEVSREAREQTCLRVFSSYSDAENKKWIRKIIGRLERSGNEEYKKGVIAGLELGKTICCNQIAAFIDDANGGSK